MHNRTTTPPPASCPIWCTQQHTASHPDHTRDVGMWDLGRSTIEAFLHQAAGHDRAPVVRVMFGPDWAPAEVLDVPVEMAAKLGDVIRLLSIRTYSEFGQALTRAAALAGKESAR